MLFSWLGQGTLPHIALHYLLVTSNLMLLELSSHTIMFCDSDACVCMADNMLIML